MGQKHSRDSQDFEFGKKDIDALMLKFERIDSDHDGTISLEDILKIPTIHDNILVPRGLGNWIIYFGNFG